MKQLIADLKTDIYNLQHKILHAKQIILDWQSNEETVEDQKVLIWEYRKAIWLKRFEILKLYLIKIIRRISKMGEIADMKLSVFKKIVVLITVIVSIIIFWQGETLNAIFFVLLAILNNQGE